MNVALGLKAHSGWAALVVVGRAGQDLRVIDRRRLELVDAADVHWAKQPYHAADALPPAAAQAMVTRGIASAERLAMREMHAAIERAQGGGHRVTACAVLVGEPMPAWTVDEILAVHIRMHKAEGALFRDVLALAASACGLTLVTVSEKRLSEQADEALGASSPRIKKTIAAVGKAIGPPWTRDQRDAALAAVIALMGRTLA